MNFLTSSFLLSLLILLSTHNISCENDYSEAFQTYFKPQSPSFYFEGKLGEPCNISRIESCNILGAYCTQGICSCLPFYVPEISRNECLLKADRLGDSCVADVQCSAAFSSNAKCGDNNTCICIEGSVPNDDKTECLIGEKLPGEECVNGTECVGYPDKSECFNDTCKCRNGFLPALNHQGSEARGCLPIVNRFGDKCFEKQQCQQGTLGQWSNCTVAPLYGSHLSDICTCADNAIVAFGAIDPHLESDFCFKKAERIGDSCNFDEQCTVNLGIFAECSAENNKCVCLNNSFPFNNDTTCLPTKVSIGDTCQLTSQCVGKPNVTSVCTTDEICLCVEGFIPNANFSECLPMVDKLGASCVESWQCNTGQDSECAEYSWKKGTGKKVCKCKDGYFQEPRENVCRPKVMKIGSFCRTHTQCIASLKRSLCVKGECQCVGGAEAVSIPLSYVNAFSIVEYEYECGVPNQSDAGSMASAGQSPRGRGFMSVVL
ncbi:unnamed protein product [Orchesella dallaii]|uniref:EB domain-containing protein n=1 Tax=Orchesella dallaii TaxID=48710 RepID=A0ABP1REW2_9HEXA